MVDPKKFFFDKRNANICSYCNGYPETTDHVPSKVLLDKPYPNNLPVVGACLECNNGFSADEEYVSCLIECMIQNTTIPNSQFRDKVKRTLNARPHIARKINHKNQYDLFNDQVLNADEILNYEKSKILNVFLKLARGHISYELNYQQQEEPYKIEFFSFVNMSPNEIDSFNTLAESSEYLLPEIGSRAFLNTFTNGLEKSSLKSCGYNQWNIVQEGRYRYALGQTNGDWVKIVLSEYLACLIIWK